MFSQQSQTTSKPELLVNDVIEPPVWQEPEPGEAAVQRRRALSKIRGHDWSAALLYSTCDIVCWVVLYAVVGYVRRDAFFVSPFEFVLVDFVALAVLLQALYVIGGYDRNTEMRG